MADAAAHSPPRLMRLDERRLADQRWLLHRAEKKPELEKMVPPAVLRGMSPTASALASMGSVLSREHRFMRNASRNIGRELTRTQSASAVGVWGSVKLELREDSPGSPSPTRSSDASPTTASLASQAPQHLLGPALDFDRKVRTANARMRQSCHDANEDASERTSGSHAELTRRLFAARTQRYVAPSEPTRDHERLALRKNERARGRTLGGRLSQPSCNANSDTEHIAASAKHGVKHGVEHGVVKPPRGATSHDEGAVCPACSGSGTVVPPPTVCAYCGGRGWLVHHATPVPRLLPRTAEGTCFGSPTRPPTHGGGRAHAGLGARSIWQGRRLGHVATDGLDEGLLDMTAALKAAFLHEWRLVLTMDLVRVAILRQRRVCDEVVVDTLCGLNDEGGVVSALQDVGEALWQHYGILRHIFAYCAHALASTDLPPHCAPHFRDPRSSIVRTLCLAAISLIALPTSSLWVGAFCACRLQPRSGGERDLIRCVHADAARCETR